jgi:hypothetical protein
MLAGGERERKKERGRLPYEKEPELSFKILKASLLYLGSLSCRSFRPGLPKKAS